MDELAFYFSNDDDCSSNSLKQQRHVRQKEGTYPRPTSLFVEFPNTNTDANTSVEYSAIPISTTPGRSTSKKLSESRSILGMNRARDCKSFCCLSNIMPQQLPPEVEIGNIEYKRKLINPTPNRFEHLVTQMKWRLNEGGGQAIYRLGVDDDGHISGLEPLELAHSLATLYRMAKCLNATVHPLRERTVNSINTTSESELNTCMVQGSRKAVELLVRQCPSDNQGKPSVCIAVLGGVDAGKSTLIGVLTDGELDNARGRARLNLFRHVHEVQSGRTSSLSSELLGFDASGSVTNYTRTDGRLCRATAEEVARNSTEVVTLLDLAGHSKYQRTTLAGLARGQPVGVLLVVSATAGLTAVSLEHAQLAQSLGLPMAVVITKIDQLINNSERSKQVNAIYRQLVLTLKQIEMQSGVNSDRVIDQSHLGDTTECSSHWFNNEICGSHLLFAVSAVTGEGIDKLTHFLSRLGRASRLNRNGERSSLSNCRPSTGSDHYQSSSDEPIHQSGEEEFLSRVTLLLQPLKEAFTKSTMCFWISEVFTCVPGVQDPVVFGSLKSGQLRDNQLAWLGPDPMGDFHLVRIVSLKHNRQPHQSVYAGQTASVAIRFLALTCASSFPSSPSSPMANGTSELDELFQFDHDENFPGATAKISTLFKDQLPQPTVIRRGMVLISHLSWSDQYGSLGRMVAPIPVKLPHAGGVNCSVAVAWTVELELRQRLSFFSGFSGCSRTLLPPLPLRNQRVTIYAGCVAQTAIVLSEQEHHHTRQPISPSVRLLVRFARHPEYLEVGRLCILSWAGYAKAVGYVTSLQDLARTDPTSPSNTTYSIQPDGRLDWIAVPSDLSREEASTGSPFHTCPNGYMLSFLSEPECEDKEFPRNVLGMLSTSLNSRLHWPSNPEHCSMANIFSTVNVPSPLLSQNSSDTLKPPVPLTNLDVLETKKLDSVSTVPESNTKLVIDSNTVPDQTITHSGQPPQRRKRRRKRRGQ